MSRCLRDRTLLLLYEGERTAVQRGHLSKCESCGARYQRLTRDLERIGQVLREEPPRGEVVRGSYRPVVPWLSVTAGLMVALALAWGGLWTWNRTPPVPTDGADNEEVWRFLEEASTALLMPDTASGAEDASQASDFPYVPATLGEELPCEGVDLFLGCEG